MYMYMLVQNQKYTWFKSKNGICWIIIYPAKTMILDQMIANSILRMVIQDKITSHATEFFFFVKVQSLHRSQIYISLCIL